MAASYLPCMLPACTRDPSHVSPLCLLTILVSMDSQPSTNFRSREVDESPALLPARMFCADIPSAHKRLSSIYELAVSCHSTLSMR